MVTRPLFWLCTVAGLGLLHASHVAKAANTVRDGREESVEFQQALKVEVLETPVSALNVPVRARKIYLQPSVRTLEKRLEATTQRRPYSEELNLKVSRVRVENEVARIASAEVRTLLENESALDPVAVSFLEGLSRRVEDETLSLDGRDLRWLDLQRLSDRIRVASRMPVLLFPEWRVALQSEEGRDNLERHFGIHWPRVEAVLRDAAAGKRGFADEDWLDADRSQRIKMLYLLPEHMKDLHGRYSSFRGRNCFATALLFGDPAVVDSRKVNVMREPDHHHAMINSDEFSEALWRGYRLLDRSEETEGLRFGDLVVLRDQGEGEGYRSYLHAAVHVGGEYYFHKPSKSASSPIEFTSWREMIGSWARHAKSLTYEVYRKKPITVQQYTNPTALDLKIDWTP